MLMHSFIRMMALNNSHQIWAKGALWGDTTGPAIAWLMTTNASEKIVIGWQ